MAKKKSSKGAKKISMDNRPVQKIVEFYFMLPKEVKVKELSSAIVSVPQEKIEIWLELNLMEVVMEHDSLIFQDARDCFVDPLDLDFIKEHQVLMIYEISFDTRDVELTTRVLRELLEKYGGMICSDTETFDPIYTLENLEKFESADFN